MLVIAFFAVFFIYMLVVNYLLPMQSDDFSAYLHATEHFSFSNFSYFTWNGRLGEMLNTSFVARFVGTPYFDIANAVVATLFVYLLFYMVYARNPKTTKDFLALVIVFLSMILFFNFGANFIWGAGALNYLWGITILIGFMIPYRIYANHTYALKKQSLPSTKSKTIITAILMAIFGFISGFSSELLVPLSIVTLVVFGIFTLVRRKKIPLWFYIGILFLIIGFIVFYLSPGTSIRVDALKNIRIDGILRYMSAKEFFTLSTQEMLERANMAYHHFFKSIVFVSVFFSFLPVVVKFFKRGIKLYVAIVVLLVLSYLTRFFLDVYFVGIILILLLICALVLRKTLRVLYTKLFFLFLAWAFLGGLSVLFIGLPHRAHMGDHIVSLITLLLVLGYFYKDYEAKFNLKKILNWLLPIGTIIYALYVLFAYYNYYTLQKEALHEIKTQKANGIQDLVIDPKFYKRTRFYDRLGEWDGPSSNASQWPNTDIAKYYHVKSFRLGKIDETSSIKTSNEASKDLTELNTKTDTLESKDSTSKESTTKEDTTSPSSSTTPISSPNKDLDTKEAKDLSTTNETNKTTSEAIPNDTKDTNAPPLASPTSSLPASSPTASPPIISPAKQATTPKEDRSESKETNTPKSEGESPK
ncbi:hypothetical protein BKH43_01585 [Helicobacter sp. 13S00401-1]|uniref:DUF6056 family protein n=1 Tax=Helicobacter sp. 13S00401-1 TaxID=1905758 RepID=UPI000BA6FB83|nr:DUF6056 family protein [Helicobacter sp. 13S00401-1]PAF51358.1 hypothetical protein BKH43_01585 [Helicobacter sp. 13S00401-1]